MYGKIFETIYDGTLAEDWRALITFQQMIVLCDADGTIDMTPSAISRRTGIPLEHIIAGIEILEKPDHLSRTPDAEGRRIIRLDDHRDWGWSIVNHHKYKHMQDAAEVREQTRERVRRFREKQRQQGNDASRDVTPCNAEKRYTDTDTDTEKDLFDRSFEQHPDFSHFWQAYPRKVAKAAAEKAWKKLKPDHALMALILKALEAQKRTEAWTKDNGAFIPHPATWLNQRRWEDELPQQAAPRSTAAAAGFVEV